MGTAISGKQYSKMFIKLKLGMCMCGDSPPPAHTENRLHQNLR